MRRAVKSAITVVIQSVKMTKIYTKKGDQGKTNLLNGKRVFKSNPLIETEGAVDELSSLIGFTIIPLKNKSDKIVLFQIQKDLYQIMAFLAGSKKPIVSLSKRIKFLEQYIDKTSLKLPKLNRFVLPQGGNIGSRFHLTRTVCRRAERRAVFLFQKKRLVPKRDKESLLVIIKYLNRLSDFFFIIARKYTPQEITIKFNL